MFLFIGREKKVVVPSEKICRITLSGKKITLYYDSGECTFLDSTGASVAPKIDSVVSNYETEEIASDVLRSFYVACRNNEGAFYF